MAAEGPGSGRGPGRLEEDSLERGDSCRARCWEREELHPEADVWRKEALGRCGGWLRARPDSGWMPV